MPAGRVVTWPRHVCVVEKLRGVPMFYRCLCTLGPVGKILDPLTIRVFGAILSIRTIDFPLPHLDNPPDSRIRAGNSARFHR